MNSGEALITPALLRWAREQQGLSVEDVARIAQVSPDMLTAWEQGEARPTLQQALNLARKLKVPFGYLYLSSPPPDNPPIEYGMIGRLADGELIIEGLEGQEEQYVQLCPECLAKIRTVLEV